VSFRHERRLNTYQLHKTHGPAFVVAGSYLAHFPFEIGCATLLYVEEWITRVNDLKVCLEEGGAFTN
jgi:hypothetical protein